MVSVCVPVLKRYDLLQKLLLSLQVSRHHAPHRVCVLNNGRNNDAVRTAVESVDRSKTIVDVFTPHVPMGVAASWNWFIKNIPEERIISNDDITFAPESLKMMVDSPCDLVWASGFSCFLIRDECVRKLGLFDEEISPGYGYYEDDDYLQRLDGRGTRERSATAENIECGVQHFHSATLKAATHEELLEHHRKFKIARANYMKKWNVSDAEMFGESA